MIKLAIKGHAKRGKEVIEILEMLGGENIHNYGGTFNECYIIDNNKICTIYTSVAKIDNCIIFTLEEFLEKFPYKVGDKVQHKGATSCGSVYEVEKMRWVDDHVEYEVKRLWCWNDHYTFTAEDLQPFEEENMEEREYADLRLDVDQDDKLATEVTIDGGKITPPENYLIGKVTRVDNGMLVEFVKKQPQYPKTYEECCKVLCCKPIVGFAGLDDDEENLYGNFIALKRCRDAYWKIAGEQMKLGKPWEPKLDNNEKIFYIHTVSKRIYDGEGNEIENQILAFPTSEMRDTFHENFKYLIEQCKELL